MAFSIYSVGSKKIIRVITLIAIFILAISSYGHFLRMDVEEDVIFTLVQNAFVIVLSIILFIKPSYLGIITFITFQYSFISLYFDPRSIMSLLMFILGFLILITRGFFRKHRTTKMIFVLTPPFALYLSELRFGLSEFLSSSIYRMGHVFVIALIILFFVYNDREKYCPIEKTLNLSKYPELKKRDAEWLTAIQNNIKYESIAIDYQLSIGSVKNRLKFIFDTLEVGDKTGFLNKYSDYEIIFV